MILRPSYEEYARLAECGKIVPLWGEILADLETPLSAYWKLASRQEPSFLLESVTGGEQVGRYSFLGAGSPRLFRSKNRKFRWVKGAEIQEGELQIGETPLDEVRKCFSPERYVTFDGLPRFTGGAVGMLSYDLVRFFEKLPDNAVDELQCDDVLLMFTDTVVAFDHSRNRIQIISYASPGGDSYDEATERIKRVASLLSQPLPPLPDVVEQDIQWMSHISRDAYESAVERAIQAITAGEGIQIVLSQRLSAPISAHPLHLYRQLRSLNPSPYMYLLRFGDVDVVGASPEILVTLEKGVARVRPIAGTRKRGQAPAEDRQYEQELLADEKERAEHIMLVDLGRNDLGRVCEPGSVRVNELMIIERYSHVMHLVSDVTGVVKPECDAFDVFRACFPAGTVTGAPKVRAMEIIDELEPTRRGFYAGAVGYFGFTGNMDMAITIRTLFLKDGVAYLQAGAGIVYDSKPDREWEECQNKMAGMREAVQRAHQKEPWW